MESETGRRFEEMKGEEMGDSTTHTIDELLAFGKEALKTLGDQALAFYAGGNPELKFDEGLVTEAELRLTDTFQRRLKRQFPEHVVFSSSPGEKDYTHEERRHLWILDALDGVANFQSGIPVWGMSLALLENFWPVLGLFYMPVTRDLFHAKADHRAFWGDHPISVSPQETINDESLLFTYARFHRDYRPNFPGKIRSLGCTAAHICYVAMGCAEAALMANESFKGLAAVRVIIEAAGGEIHKMDGSDFFLNEYLDGQRIDDHLLASSPHTQRQVRTCLRS